MAAGPTGWTWDAPSGAYKNHFLSRNIRMSAIANSQFMRYCQPERGYGKGKGDTVNITRIFDLPLATRVAEGERLPVGRPAIDNVSVAVSEWGYEIEMSEFEKNLTYYDITNRFQQRLRDQIRLTCDKMAADAMKLTQIKATAETAGAVTYETVVGGGAPAATGLTNLNVRHLKSIHDYMSGTLKAPTFSDGYYVGILSTTAARGIKNDSEFRDWYAPHGKNEFIKGHLADVENFHLIETNHFDALANLAGASSVQGEAVFFGMDPTFLAEVETPELRRGVPENLGRFSPFGWVGTLEAGNTWPETATGRTVHFTSA